MRGAAVFLVGVVLAAGLAAACGEPGAPAADAGDDPGRDAGADGAQDQPAGAADAGLADAPPDTGPALPHDASIDAASVSPPDAALMCGECPSPGPCATSVCEAGTCVEEPVADGQACAADDGSVCVAGSCVVRRCGDGYREPGPAPAREACDDGQPDVGGAPADACDDTCAPRPFAVAWRPAGSDLPGGPRPAVGVDDAGRALVLFNSTISSRAAALIGRRHDAHGVATGATIVVDDGLYPGWPTEASVLGVDDGWVVVWVTPEGDGDGAGVQARRVFGDGHLGEPVVVSTQVVGDQRSPTLARTSSGRLVVVWTADGTSSAADTVVRARLFSMALVPESDELTVTSGDGRDEQPVVAATTAGFVIVWTRAQAAPLAVPVVMARRFFDSGSAWDAAPWHVSDVAPDGAFHDGATPALATLDDGRFIAAWSTRNVDPRGDVRARRFGLANAPEPSFGAAEQPDFPELLPAVAAAPGGGALLLVHRGSSLTDLVRDVAVVVVGDGGGGDDLLVPAVLTTRLASSGRQRLASVVRAASALWFVWGDDVAAAGAPSQSTWAFFLPID